MSDESRQGFGEPAYSAGVTPEVFVRKYGPAVRAVCLANARNCHDAEDISQEAMLKALSGLRTLRDERAAGKWIVRIARNSCVDFYRRVRVTASINNDIPDTSQCYSMANVLHNAILALPIKYREVISLYYMDGRRCESVAMLLGITAAAVRKRLARARLMLHKALREETV